MACAVRADHAEALQEALLAFGIDAEIVGTADE
jgi:hypothetical protein